MSIRCACPNGHSLTVNEAFAGRSGMCPKCRALLKVPALPKPRVSEDEILEIILGQGAPRPKALALSAEELERDALQRGHGEHATPNKTCDQCNHEIAAGAHICPFCHTYIANLHDFR